jgi:hypothetical protein
LIEGAAEIGATEEGGAIRGGAVEGEIEREFELFVDGVAGAGVGELEGETIPGGDAVHWGRMEAR